MREHEALHAVYFGALQQSIMPHRAGEDAKRNCAALRATLEGTQSYST